MLEHNQHDDSLENAIYSRQATRFLMDIFTQSNAEVRNMMLDTHPEFLYLTAGWGTPDDVKVLIEAGADPNEKNGEQGTPLLRSTFRGDLEIIQILLANKADPNIANSDGKTPLHQAAMLGDARSIEALLDANADHKLTDRDGKCPVDYAELWPELQGTPICKRLRGSIH